jgi:signal transduction histidine kinase
LLREENGRFVREAAEALGPACSSIRALLPMPDGSLLIGTQGAGIARLAQGQCRVISREHGLPHKVISQLALDPQNRVWAGSDAGIFMVPYEQLVAVAEGHATTVRATSFGRSEGVSGLQANASFPGALMLPDGQLWMATRSGIALLDTARIGHNTAPPQASIESMMMNDGEPAPLWKALSSLPQETDNIVTGSSATLPPGVRSLAFEFGASSYVAPESVSIRYQLQGIDREPRIADADRRAVYGRIPPGDYTLQVSACNNDGVWSTHETALSLIVLPFYYETLWFRTLCVIAAIALVIVLGYRIARARYRRRTEELRRQAALDAERTRIARDMHDQIGASLTQISLLSDIALAQGAGIPQLPRLADTARQAVTSLDEIVWAVDPKQDRFDSLLEYLAPQITELTQAANLRCRLDFPPHGIERHLPAHFRHQLFLTIREAVNNTIKHAKATELKIAIHPTDDELHIEISDNGTGFSPDTPRGNGLNNMQARIQELGGALYIDSHSNTGTRITFTLLWPATAKS